jgi:hypothetical protein
VSSIAAVGVLHSLWRKTWMAELGFCHEQLGAETSILNKRRAPNVAHVDDK